MTFDSFIHKIPEIKRLTPAGLSAQALMVPKQRESFLHINSTLESNARQSAVMMLLYPKGSDLSVLLIQRAICGGVHSGQIGFPGGAYDKTDLDLKHTALRETFEEVGIESRQISCLKEFTKVYVPPSNFVVQPFLGVLSESPIFNCNPSEVAGIIELPVKALLSDQIVQQVSMKTSYADFIQVPAFVYQKYIIWGATAMMLSELREAIKHLYNRR
ncbi:NUDIX hydrolase [Myroides sp. LJL119]